MEEGLENRPDICPQCYRPKSEHAADCTYEAQLEKTKKTEGITPEFEAGVRSGAINYGQQIKEINETLKEIFESAPAAEPKYDAVPKNMVEISATIKYCEAHMHPFEQMTPMIMRHVELVAQMQEIQRQWQEVLSTLKKVKASGQSNVQEIEILASSAHDLKLMVDSFESNFNKTEK